jgi:hypothetical protein
MKPHQQNSHSRMNTQYSISCLYLGVKILNWKQEMKRQPCTAPELTSNLNSLPAFS